MKLEKNKKQNKWTTTTKHSVYIQSRSHQLSCPWRSHCFLLVKGNHTNVTAIGLNCGHTFAIVIVSQKYPVVSLLWQILNAPLTGYGGVPFSLACNVSFRNVYGCVFRVTSFRNNENVVFSSHKLIFLVLKCF